ncbi:MAG: TonB-dependent receptor [Bacteroidales bacterium]|nr:TonB-dependent receptor [Bacteroidales bacterium]
MNKRFLLGIILVFGAVNLSAARSNTAAVRGTVVDKETENPLAYATLSVRDSLQYVVAAGTARDDGSFLLEGIPYGNYHLSVTFIGYKEHTMAIELKTVQWDAGVIAMEEDVQTLTTAVITAKVPLIEQKIDKIVMNVSEAVSTEGSNALEVLRKAPGVTIDMEGNVKLNGQPVSVWIDGRPSYMSGLELEALLRATDGTTIDKIELMAHPSARYDAEGSGGIINIKMKKNLLKGLSGTANAFYGGMKHKAYEQEGGGGTSLNLRTDKTNTMFSYSGRVDNTGVELSSHTAFGESLQMEQFSHSDMLSSSVSHTAKLANDVYLTKKHTVGFIVTTMFQDQDLDNYGNENYTDMFLNNQLLNRTKSVISNGSSFRNITSNINYTGLFNEQKSQELTFNADYAYYDIFSENSQENTIVDGFGMDQIFRQKSNQYINLFSGRLDYQQSFWKTGIIETGIKWATTQTDNNLLREDFLDTQWTPNPDLSNEFVYTEHIAAAYASVGRMLGNKWMLKLGIRGEFTGANGHWISAQEVTKKKYFNVFPTVFGGYNPSASWRFTLSYTSRIGRPSFSQLNPFRAYIDANSYIVGNPNLDPQLSDQVVLGVNFKTHYNLALLYSHVKDFIMQNPYYDQEGTKILLYDNFGTQSMAGGVLSLSELPLTKWLYLTVNGTCIYLSNTAVPEQGQSNAYSNNGLLTNVYSQVTLVLPKNWKIELMGLYQGKVPAGYFVVAPMYFVNGGIKKNFMNNKATLSLNVNDIFGTFNNNLVLTSDNAVQYKIDQRVHLQKVRISFSIRFGQGKAARTRKVGDLEEASRIDPSAVLPTGTSEGVL